MRYQWRVSIPSRQGYYEKILSHDDLDALRSSESIGQANAKTFALLIITWGSFLGDSPVDQLKPNKVIDKFLKELVRDPIKHIADLSELAHDLEISLEIVDEEVVIRDDLYVRFKKTPIFREFLDFTKTHSPVTLKYILSFLNFGKKVFYINEQLDSVAFRKWSQVEDRLSTLIVPDWVSNVKTIMAFIMKGWSDFCFLPKHGNGAVSERSVWGTESKNETISFPPGIDYLYNKQVSLLGEDVSFTIHIPDGTPTMEKVVLSSRLMFVPKTWKTSRSICMEPVVYQWAQQGVRPWLEHGIGQSVLRNHVVLSDQTVNQRAAQYGSKTNKADTIDLASASDSVAWALIKRVFPAGALKHLAATRTKSTIVPDGSTVHVHKFAPMGSALCFPVQSLLYSAIVAMVTIADAYNLDWRVDGSLSRIKNLDVAWNYCFGDGRDLDMGRSAYFPFRCYGDDIVVDNATTSNVIEALTALGFEVNADKSFVGNKAYRESCGKHYFRGDDVTPYRFKTKPVTQRMSVDALASVIDAANRAGEFGYVFLRKHLIQFCLYHDIHGINRKPGTMNPVLFSEDEDSSLAIYSTNARNNHLRSRNFGDPGKGTHNDYQRSEVLSISLGPTVKRKLSRKFDNYHYTVWWNSRYYNSGESSLDDSSTVLTADTRGLGVRWRWTPT